MLARACRFDSGPGYKSYPLLFKIHFVIIEISGKFNITFVKVEKSIITNENGKEKESEESKEEQESWQEALTEIVFFGFSINKTCPYGQVFVFNKMDDLILLL